MEDIRVIHMKGSNINYVLYPVLLTQLIWLPDEYREEGQGDIRPKTAIEITLYYIIQNSGTTRGFQHSIQISATYNPGCPYLSHLLYLVSI